MMPEVVPIGHSPSIDLLETAMTRFKQVDCEVTHCFTPGLYRRSVVVPKGVLATSKIHKTRHQFVILRGDISVWTEDGGWVRIKAPFVGVTEAGSRRVGFAHEETEWMTFHATEAETPEEVEAEIIEPHEPGLPRVPEDALALLEGVI